MDDVRYEYFQDLKEKNDLKKQIRYRNQTGRGGMKLDSDRLTRKEWEKMNGKVSSWNYNYFYDWKTFTKGMPDHIKIEYLNYIMNKYAVGPSHISEYVFGKSRPLLAGYFKNHPEIQMYVNVPSPGFKAKAGDLERFKKDIEAFRSTEFTHSEPESEAEIEPEEAVVITEPEFDTMAAPEPVVSETKSSASIHSVNFAMYCDGKYEASEAIWSILDMVGDGKLHIRVIIDKESDENAEKCQTTPGCYPG